MVRRSSAEGAVEMSNASDRPEPGEGQGAAQPGSEPDPQTGDRPTAPVPEQDETRPEAKASAAEAEPVAPEPAATESATTESAATEPVATESPAGRDEAVDQDTAAVASADQSTASDGGPRVDASAGGAPPGSGDGPGIDMEKRSEGGAGGAADATEPGPTVPGYAPPSPYGPPGYGPQGHEQPGYGQAGHEPPGFGQPAYGPPAYGPPPGYGQPSGYGLPPYGGGPGDQAPRPGIVPLRPLVAGDVVAGAVRYIRENPLTTLGTSAVVMIVGQGLQLIVEYALPRIDPAALARGRVGGLVGSMLGVLGSTFVSIVLSAVLAGLLLVVLSQAVLGRRIGARDAWRVVAPRAPGLVGLTLLIALVMVVILLIPVLLALVAGATGTGEAIALGVVLIMAAVAATVYLSVLWALAPAAYVLEPIGVPAAMRRSARLLSGSWWRTFGILLLSGLLIAIPAVVVLGVFGALVERPTGIGEMVRAAIAYLVVGTFATPFGVGVTGLLYVDQRIRRERLDLELARYPAAPR
jgi:hypothetical protein